jgi:hypothetical protein
MEISKAPGPNNIPGSSTNIVGKVVKDDIFNLFIHFHLGKLDVKRLNYGFITLLLKPLMLK